MSARAAALQEKVAVGQRGCESKDGKRAAPKSSKNGADAGGWVEVKGQSAKSPKASASAGLATQQPKISKNGAAAGGWVEVKGQSAKSDKASASPGLATLQPKTAAQPTAEPQAKPTAAKPFSVAPPGTQVEPKKKKKKKVVVEAPPAPPPSFVFEDDFPMLGAAAPVPKAVPKAPSARAWGLGSSIVCPSYSFISALLLLFPGVPTSLCLLPTSLSMS